MSDPKHTLWVLLGLTLTVGVSARSSFAQGVQHKMSPPPAAPKATILPKGNWLPKVAYIKASNNNKYQQFGSAVALSGDGNTLAVGATNEESGAKGVNSNQNDHSALNSGAVYIYARTPAGWKQQAYLKSSNTAEGYLFGGAVSLSYDGNLLAVGSTGEASSATGINGNQSDNSMPGSGAAYLFARTGITWKQQAFVKSSNTGAADIGYQFGYAVALSSDGSTLAVSETSDPSNATGTNGDDKNKFAPDSGAVFVFAHAGDSWVHQAYIKPWNSTNAGALFGYAVALSGNGDTLAVGSQNEDAGKGAVYAFQRHNGLWSQQTRFAPGNIERDDQLGCSVAISDDGNTILAGSCEEDAFLVGIQPPDSGADDRDLDSSTGAAYVFVRNDSHWSQQAYIKSFNTRIDDQFGWALAISRDGNTIAIGSHLEDSGAKGINGDETDFSMEDSGAVYIYTRAGTTWTPAAYVKAPNTRPAAEFGIAVSLNADGKVLAVGAFREDGAAKGVNGNLTDQSATWAGATYVYY